jgi:hypothetical protein
MNVDIVIQETIDVVDITVNPNIIEVNVTRTSGGGGSQTLAQTLDLGNQTGGENILVNDADAIELENTSLLKKGSYDFGGDGGISRICSVGFEDMWQAGIRHVFDNNGLLRHSTNCFDIIPDSSFDNTLRFKVDSLWTLDSGVTYKCTDASTGAAVWELYNTDVPTLQQVTYEGNVTSNDVIVRNPDDALKQVVIHRPDAGDDMSYVLAQYDAVNSISIAVNESAAIVGTTDTNGTSELSSLGLLIVSGGTSEMQLAGGNLILGSTIDQPQIGMQGINGAVAINTDLLTANREQQIPDKDGTFAMLDDVVAGVPYTGATADVNLGAFDLYTSKQWLYDAPNDNYGSLHYTDGNFHIEDGDGHPLLVLEDEFMQIHKSATIQSNLWTSLLTAIRDHYLPNESGTIALTSIVADAITDGVTNKAPSQNAVFDALQFTRRLITNGSGSVTGTLTETILTSLTIPANTLDSKCFVWSTMDYFKPSAGTCTLRLYINNANTLTGATLLGFVTMASNRNVSFNRKYFLNGTTLDLLTSLATTQANNEFIEGLFGASTTLTVNPAADIFLIYTTQNDAVGTVATAKLATVQKLKLN